jgi:peptidoglycan hydrolase-like protein with peptidoglycan-binding domain
MSRATAGKPCAQRTLNSRGFRAGPTDDTLNSQAQQAQKEFQKSENLDDSGRPNSRTLAALGVREDESPRPVQAYARARTPLQPSAKCSARLNARGFNAGTPDGILGAEIRAALREFQRSANLVITEEPNSRTLDALGIKQPVAVRGG